VQLAIFRTCASLGPVFVYIATGLSVSPQEHGVPNELPRSWSMEHIAKQAPPIETKEPVYVLAWKVMEDDRPMRVESCLVLKVLENNKRYCLAHLWRNPTDRNSRWDLRWTHVSGLKGTKYYPGLWLMHAKTFEKKPSNKELYAALSPEEVDWPFELEKGWNYVGCGVCEESWKEAIGEKPTRFFGQ
jgi:hypothetical protein